MPARSTARHRTRRGFRARYLLWAVPAAALVSGGLYLSGAVSGSASATGASDTALTAGNCTSAATPATPGGPDSPGIPGLSGTPSSHCARPSPAATSAMSATPTPSHPPAGKKHPAAGHHSSQPAPSSPPAAKAPHSPSPASLTSEPAQPGQYALAQSQVLALINQARAQAGLAPYTVTGGLVRSASGHTQLMASGCGLSHQCPGEPPLGTRETNAGVQWTSAGENIGEAGPISRTAAAIAQAAVGLTQDMLNEKPPDDGHRLNILSSSFHHAGICVLLDSSGTVWMTQDFSS